MNIDVNKPVENPKLKTLLKQYREQEETKRGTLAEMIAEELAQNAHLLAVIHIDENGVEHKEDGTGVFKQGSVLSFEMLQDPRGTDYLPVFTDWDELRKNERYQNEHVNTLIVSFDDIAAVTKGKAGTVLNPFSDNFIITPANVVHIKKHKDELAKGYSENTVEKDTPVKIGDPADYPTEMTEAVKQYAKTDRSIDAIWLKLMMKEGEKSYLFIVDHHGDQEKVFSGIAKTAVPHIHNGLPVDMVPLSDSFGKKAASGKPFYKRRLFG